MGKEVQNLTSLIRELLDRLAACRQLANDEQEVIGDEVMGRVDFVYDNAQLPIMNDVNLEMRFKASALDQFCKELEGVGTRARTLATLQRFTV